MPSRQKILQLLGFLLLTFNGAMGHAGDTSASGRAAEAMSAAGPKTPASKTITNFSQALRCMDEVFLAHGKKGIAITSAGIPDETGKVRTGTKEMMITAISTMTTKSQAFEFIDFHSGDNDLGRLFEARGDKSRKLPNFYIRGSITQLDESVVRKTEGAGVSASSDSSESFNPVSLAMSGSRDRAYDQVSMDMSIGDSATRRILAVTVTSNTMTMSKAGKSGEGGGKIGKMGLSFSLDRSSSEGLGAATRALLELNLIETLGKFTQVPYWRCLDTDITNPLILEQARENYDMLKERERIMFVQRKLGGSMNRYKGPKDGLINDELKQAVREYQATIGLVANGQISFEVYAHLLDDVQNALAVLPTASSVR